MFPARIETDRLVLERISHGTVDVSRLHEFYRDDEDAAEMFEYWDSSPHDTFEETVEYVDEAEQMWEEGRGAKYVIRPKEGEDGAGAIAGTTGLYPDWERRSANLGIIIDTRFWGRGYAGERADALLEVAFERLDLDLVVTACIDGNERSKRAIEKYVERYGGEYDGLFRNQQAVAESGMDLHRYTISREQYADAVES